MEAIIVFGVGILLSFVMRGHKGCCRCRRRY